MFGRNIWKFGCVCLMAMATAACDAPRIEGEWIEPAPGMEEVRQGFVLEPGGAASSVGMATLLYERWERQGDRLVLGGRSVGNRRTILFSDTLEIRSLTRDRLTLRTADGVERCFRRR